MDVCLGSVSTNQVHDFIKSQRYDYYHNWSENPDESKIFKDKLFGIYLHNKLIGLAGYKRKPKYFIPQFNNRYWIHYIIGEKSAGSGIATIAVRKLLLYMSSKGIKTVYAGVNRNNQGSLRLLEKLDFKQVAERSETKVFMHHQ